MAQPPDMRSLRLDDASDDDILFDSPDDAKSRNRDQRDLDAPFAGDTPPRPGNARQANQEDRDAALRKELESIRGINKVIEDVVESLEKAKGNMDTVQRTVHSASTLLNTWTRILSQTEHNQRLILDPNWQGATQDLEDVENESIMRQQAAERRAAEEQARREAAIRRAEDEERRKAAAPPTVRGTRGRGRGLGSSRLTSTSTSTTTTPGYVGVGGQGGRGRAASRVASGIGRGTRGARGRGVS